MSSRTECRIRIDVDQSPAFGTGKIRLLESIHGTGSVTKSAKSLGMSSAHSFTLFCLSQVAYAQVSNGEGFTPMEGVDIINLKSTKIRSQIRIASSDFRNQEISPQKISTIIIADLEGSGQFKNASAGSLIDERSRPNFVELKKNGYEYLLTGSVSKKEDGRFDIRYRLASLI